MADSNTPNILLLVADPADVIQYSNHIGNNLTTIDGLMGAVDCLSTARPSNTYKGQIVYEHDSRRYAQNTGTKASPTWTYMSHQAMAVTGATRPTSGLTDGMLAYETDTNSLIICEGGVWRYKINRTSTSSARPTSVEAAATIYETDTTRSMVYDGTSWKSIGAAVMNTPQATSANGTATSGTTDTMDSVLGTYQFQAVSGRRYEVRVNNLLGNGSVIADQYVFRVRDSGSNLTPTTSSTQVAASGWTCQAAGSSGRTPIPLAGTFVAGSTGTHTLAFFAARIGGTGVFTPLSADSFPRELFVYDTGSN